MQFLTKQKQHEIPILSADLLAETAGMAQPVGARPALQPTGIDRRFQRLVKPRDWARLPVAVQRRFLKRLAPGQSVVFRGQIHRMNMSLLGQVLAQLVRTIGAPLPLDGKGAGQSASVAVSDDPTSGGQYWTRIYNRRHGFPQAVHSSKRFTGPTGLEEHIGAGIVIALRVEVSRALKNPGLLFISDHYALDVLGLRWRLPGWLAPGRMVVGHYDLGDSHGPGAFAFTLDLDHPWFGALMRQTVFFTDMEEVCHAH